jgi:hypothetical protein
MQECTLCLVLCAPDLSVQPLLCASAELVLSAERRSRGSRLLPSDDGGMTAPVADDLAASGVGAADLAAARALSPLFGRLRAAGGDSTDAAVPSVESPPPSPPRLNIFSRCTQWCKPDHCNADVRYQLHPLCSAMNICCGCCRAPNWLPRKVAVFSKQTL